MTLDFYQRTKMPAGNGRFGASGAVARPKVCANLEVLRPSERQCKPRLRQAAGALEAMRGQTCTLTKEQWKKNHTTSEFFLQNVK